MPEQVLAEVRPGDTVLISSCDKLCERTGTVLRVTPSGRVVVFIGERRNTYTFNPDGREYGGRHGGWTSWCARPATAEDVARVADAAERAGLAAALSSVVWAKQSLDTLRAVAGLIGKEAPEVES